MSQARVFAFLAAAGLCAACAGTPKPNNQMIDTQAALRAAHEVGADADPQAQLHSKLAKEQIELAEKSIKDGDNERASRLLARAKADAELALVLARRANVETDVRRMQ